MISCRRLSSSRGCEPALVWAGNVVFGSTCVQRGSVLVGSNGRIESCHPRQTEVEAKSMANARNIKFRSAGNQSVLSPGLIDVHCHISELGRDWEGYHSATRAAAAGGITTIMGMPLNSLPPTTSKEAFQMEIDAASKIPLMSDVGLWGGVVPDSMDDLDELLECGVFGIKAFLAPLPESAGYQAVPPSVLACVALKCGANGIPVLVHSELMTQEEVETSTREAFSRNYLSPSDAHLLSRPAQWERDAIQVVCDLADKCHMHIVHISDAGSLDLIEATKRRPSATLTVETCPHYLLLNSETSQTPLTKCFPPIRNEQNRQELWRGIQSGLIDMVASDHSPCSAEMRNKSMQEAWGGIAGLQYQLQATVTGMKSLGYTDHEIAPAVARLWSEEPAKMIPGFQAVKGKLEPGMQADFCVWDLGYGGPSPTNEHHRWKGASPFAKMDLNGRVMATFLNGVEVYNGESDTFLEDSKAPGTVWVRG